MNKTLYIRDEDAPLWDRARELSRDKLSPVLVDALRRFVDEKEARAKGFDRIVVNYDDSADHDLPRAKAFYGRWIINRDEPLRVGRRFEGHKYVEVSAVAETAKGSVVVYTYNENEHGSWAHRFLIFSSFEDAAADPGGQRRGL